MQAAVHVAVVPLVEARDRVDHRARFVGCRRVVQVDQRAATDVLVEDREIDPEIGEIRHGAGRVQVVASGLANASSAACQASVAHLIRAGNACTPANAATSENSSGSRPVVTMSLNSSNNARASETVRPRTCVVINDALACEIAQPAPSKLASSIRSPTTRR